MNIQEIKDRAPDGATHYFPGGGEYVKAPQYQCLDSNGLYYWNGDQWHSAGVGTPPTSDCIDLSATPETETETELAGTCPVCGADCSEGGHVETGVGGCYATQTCSCENGHSWIDTYKLIRQDILED